LTTAVLKIIVQGHGSATLHKDKANRIGSNIHLSQAMPLFLQLVRSTTLRVTAARRDILRNHRQVQNRLFKPFA
jgi:hypothetical protein